MLCPRWYQTFLRLELIPVPFPSLRSTLTITFSNFLTAVYASPYYPRPGLLPRLFRPAAINDDDIRFKISVMGINVKFSACHIKTADTTHRPRE